MLHNQVSNRIRETRKNLGLTQAQLADLCGISRVSIVAIETGRFLPTIETALRLSRALNTGLDDLFELKETEK